jgi:hypothetical protein
MNMLSLPCARAARQTMVLAGCRQSHRKNSRQE